jgi:hypothetical protein
VGWIEAGEFYAGLCGEPLHCGDGWWACDDFGLRAFDLFSGLRAVAAIGEEAGGAARNGECGARSGKAAEIADIWKVCDEQPGKAGLRNATA